MTRPILTLSPNTKVKPSVKRPSNDTTHYLYLFFTKDDECLYIGETKDFLTRFNQHRLDKPWFDDHHYVSVFVYPNEATAKHDEGNFIQNYSPKHNGTGESIQKKPSDISYNENYFVTMFDENDCPLYEYYTKDLCRDTRIIYQNSNWTDKIDTFTITKHSIPVYQQQFDLIKFQRQHEYMIKAGIRPDQLITLDDGTKLKASELNKSHDGAKVLCPLTNKRNKARYFNDTGIIKTHAQGGHSLKILKH